MSVLNKKQLLGFIDSIVRDAQINESTYTKSLQRDMDFLQIKIIDILKYQTDTTDFSGKKPCLPYEPNEGLTGRVVYKQKNIIAETAKLIKEYEDAKTLILRNSQYIRSRLDDFGENIKYYLPDEIISE